MYKRELLFTDFHGRWVRGWRYVTVRNFPLSDKLKLKISYEVYIIIDLQCKNK